MPLRSRLRPLLCVCQRRSASCHYGKIHITNQDVSSDKPRDHTLACSRVWSEAQNDAKSDATELQQLMEGLLLRKLHYSQALVQPWS